MNKKIKIEFLSFEIHCFLVVYCLVFLIITRTEPNTANIALALIKHDNGTFFNNLDRFQSGRDRN